MHRRRRFLWPILLLVAFTILFNEYLIYYTTILFGCSWPIPYSTAATVSHVAILADTHLLGRIKGHWFDKLRREWQMYRAFQTSMQILKPDAVFFLGDQFDEGQWSTEEDFIRYSERFASLFYVPKDVKVFVVAGNHDIGFHYEIHPSRVEWFSHRFHGELIGYVTVGENHFVLINSMAMEGDGCRLCQQAEQQLMRLRRRFECARNGSRYCEDPLPIPFSQPIVMQHFPLYRRSDRRCADGPDSAPEPLKSEPLREKWDCLSAESTELLLKALRPRAVFAGHTHYGCQTWWPSPYLLWEWTVPSFSWRNTPQPVLILATISPEELLVNKCLLPNELTVIRIYVAAVAVLLFSVAYQLFVYCSTARTSLQRALDGQWSPRAGRAELHSCIAKIGGY